MSMVYVTMVSHCIWLIVMEGFLGSLGTTVPWGGSSRRQGGPWAPPPCIAYSSETCQGGRLPYCVLLVFLCVVCFRYFVLGVNMLYGHFALQDPTPVS